MSTSADPGPKSSPAQSKLPGSGASKKVARLPSKTFVTVLPLLFQEPGVPMMPPVSSAARAQQQAQARIVQATKERENFCFCIEGGGAAGREGRMRQRMENLDRRAGESRRSCARAGRPRMLMLSPQRITICKTVK